MNDTNILPPRPIKPIVIPVEDEITHQAPWYFCGQPSCICHQDPELLQAVSLAWQRGELDPAAVLRMYWNQPQEGEHQS